MRIIGGKYRGRKLVFPGGPSIRPTQDRVREALFNILARDIAGVNVLDLFAGSGSFGMEALSRGARKATFVDHRSRCIHVIRKNVTDIGIADKANVIKKDVFKAIYSLNSSGERFDIVFADPPYYKGLSKKTLLKLGQYDILTPFSMVIIEHSKKDNLPEDVGGIFRKNQKQYGDTLLSFYHK